MNSSASSMPMNQADEKTDLASAADPVHTMTSASGMDKRDRRHTIDHGILTRHSSREYHLRFARRLIDSSVAGDYSHLVLPAVSKVIDYQVVLVSLPARPLPLVDGCRAGNR